MTDLAGSLAGTSPSIVADIRTNRRRLTAFGLISGLAMAGAVASSLLHLGWQSGYVVTLGVGAAFVFWALFSRDALLSRLLLWGLAVAFLEIAGADRWAVDSGTLVYAPHGPFVLRSPAYMVVSWMVAITQFGLLGLWLRDRLGMLRASLACAVIGGLNLPLYEQLAKDAGWWMYQHTPMFFSTPYYVILGELLIGGAFPLVTFEALRGGAGRAVVWAAVLGLWLWGAGAVGFHLVG